MHLGARLRPSESVRRRRTDAGRPGGLQERRVGGNQRLGQRVSRPRPSRQQGEFIMNPQGLKQPFYVIGENIHTTRVVLREGKLVTTSPSGQEAVRYVTTSGETRYLPIPEQFKSRQDYQEGKVKHVAVAIHAAMFGTESCADEGLTYIRTLAEKQVQAGADFLDLNVDELSWHRDEQKAAMDWLGRAGRPRAPGARPYASP